MTPSSSIQELTHHHVTSFANMIEAALSIKSSSNLQINKCYRSKLHALVEGLTVRIYCCLLADPWTVLKCWIDLWRVMNILIHRIIYLAINMSLSRMKKYIIRCKKTLMQDSKQGKLKKAKSSSTNLPINRNLIRTAVKILMTRRQKKIINPLI